MLSKSFLGFWTRTGVTRDNLHLSERFAAQYFCLDHSIAAKETQAKGGNKISKQKSSHVP